MALARTYITEPIAVTVTHCMPLGEKLLVASYSSEDGKDMDDIYNCADEETRKALLETTPESPVRAMVIPDTSGDIDGHPSIALVVTSEI